MRNLGPALTYEPKLKVVARSCLDIAYVSFFFFCLTKQQKIQLLATTQLLSLQTQRLKSKVGFVD